MRSRTAGLVAVLCLVLAACGGTTGDTTTSSAVADTSPAPDTTQGETTVTSDAPATSTTEGAPSGEQIVIGAAIDQTSFMAPFDNPAILAAQLTVDQINAAGGVDGQELALEIVDTQLDPEQTLSAAADLIDNGAAVLFVTCDVDFATPAVQEALERGVLAVAPCLGTDQMSPKRFGPDGELAFSFGNVAQDEGAAMAEFAIDQGWMTAAIARDNLIVYFQNAVDAFQVRYEELGGTIAVTEEFTNGDGTIGTVVSSLDSADVDVIVTSTAFDDMPALVDGIRSLGNMTPILCGWSCDGAYWTAPDLSEFYVVTFASVFGDDPSSAVNDLIQGMTDAGQAPGTGGFIGGADAVLAIADAIEATGSTDGTDLAAHLVGMTDFPATTGPISFSDEYHTVFGREYRVLVVQDGEHSVFETRRATSPAPID